GLTFAICDALFPGSKFILTIRETQSWYNSLVNFHKKVFGFDDISLLNEDFFKNKNLYLYENYVYEGMKRKISKRVGNRIEIDWGLLYEPSHFMMLYEQHNENVLRYFSNRPDDLLVIDITKEPDTGRIGDFIGADPSKTIPMPHQN